MREKYNALFLAAFEKCVWGGGVRISDMKGLYNNNCVNIPCRRINCEHGITKQRKESLKGSKGRHEYKTTSDCHTHII